MQMDEIREKAESDLLFFIQLVAPTQVLGNCHKEVIDWWTRPDAKNFQLLLFPRDHQKSRLVAYRVIWELTKNPTLRVLYLSATSNLAEKQLTFIKGILTSSIYRRYWPQHVKPEEGKRAKWTSTEISLDHPKREIENIREPSIFTGGLTTVLTGLHCDIAVLDDVVVAENALTVEGRNKVAGQYSLLTSIEGADAKEWVVGTRYHPKDLYSSLMDMKELVYNKSGEVISEDYIYEIFERPVENIGDGTGEFLWPRQQRKDGKWFGFNIGILASKRGKYLDKGQFRAQYYNDPSDPDNIPISSDKFQYLDSKFLNQSAGNWYYKGERLNVFAAIDFAYTLTKKADHTALVVLGIDGDANYYVLDIDRFKTDDIKVYFEHILKAQMKWEFRKLRAEIVSAQSVIVKHLKTMIREYGVRLAIDEHNPNRHQGNKQLRIASTLEPLYNDMKVWHYRGGNIQFLEEELQSRNPVHDDVKDALTSAVEIALKPAKARKMENTSNKIIWNSRFRAAGAA